MTRFFVAALAAVFCFAGVANAGVLRVEVSATLSLESGADTDGLDGASMFFTADFADDAVFANIASGSYQQVNALSHSFTISGASEASSNGVYQSANGIALFPNFNNRDGFQTEGGTLVSLAGIASEAGIYGNGTVPDATFGGSDPLTLAFLQAMFGTGPSTWVSEDGQTTYSFTDLLVNAYATDIMSEVPLPAALPLFVAGLCGLGFAGSRRKRQACI